MPHFTIAAARDWLKSNGKRPKRCLGDNWFWSVAGNPFATTRMNVLPVEVFRCLRGPDHDHGFIYRDWATAHEAAVEAVARAMGEGWRPEKGD